MCNNRFNNCLIFLKVTWNFSFHTGMGVGGHNSLWLSLGQGVR